MRAALRGTICREPAIRIERVTGMSIADLAAAPILVAPTPPAKPLSLFQFLRVNETEGLPAIIEQAGYEQLIVEHRTILGRNFLISDPAGVKRVLLDNAAN